MNECKAGMEVAPVPNQIKNKTRSLKTHTKEPKNDIEFKSKHEPPLNKSDNPASMSDGIR